MMESLSVLAGNLLSPLVLAFVLGMIATLVKSELEFPESILKAISVYLLFGIGIKGGVELSETSLSEVGLALIVTFFLILFIPLHAYFILRRIGKIDIDNAAGIAAHYGSVSSVTFFAALTFANSMNTPAEGYIPAIVALMEWGVIVALFIARFAKGRTSGDNMRQILINTLRGRGIILISGGLAIGLLIGEGKYEQIAPFYSDIFKGILTFYLLEMGMTAARQLKDFTKVGKFMTAFGILIPIVHGVLGVSLGYFIGMSIGGAFVLGSICASASYIDAPAAVRAALPKASPSIYLTASLGITFPFNLILGLPLYYKYAAWLYS